MQKWTIGQLTVYSVLEAVVPTPLSGLLREVPENLPAADLAWLAPSYVDGSGRGLVAIQSFFIESDDSLVVIDTCFGEGHELPYDLPINPDQYRASLAEAGFAPPDVTAVVCTHLHLDHAGRNTTCDADHWTPTYPNAIYVLAETEYTHWRQSSDPNRAGPECVEPLIEHDVVRFVAMDHAVTPHIRLIPAPGHTPGHIAVRIESDGSVAVIGGDVVHHPLQIAYPELASVPDNDPVAATVTRSRLLDQVVDEGAMLLGTHFAAPSAGTVTRGRNGFVWTPASVRSGRYHQE